MVASPFLSDSPEGHGDMARVIVKNPARHLYRLWGLVLFTMPPTTFVDYSFTHAINCVAYDNGIVGGVGDDLYTYSETVDGQEEK